MATQLQKSESLTFGYVKAAYNNAIPYQLMGLIQLFYDDWIYWVLKNNKLNQFLNAKMNETICFKSFRFKGIQFEIISVPNLCKSSIIDNKVVAIGVKIKYIPTNIEYVQFYQEIKCEALNTSIKRLYQISNGMRTKKGVIMCQVSELKPLKYVCFNIMVNIKCIKYKKECNKINYYCPINKIQKHSQFKWNINDLLLQRCKKMHFKQYICSENFDNNNWCLILYPNGGNRNSEGRSQIYLQCLHFPQNVNAILMSVRFTFNVNKNINVRGTIKPNNHTTIGKSVTSFNAFKKMKSLSISITLEITNIYDENDEIIEAINWNELGLICNEI